MPPVITLIWTMPPVSNAGVLCQQKQNYRQVIARLVNGNANMKITEAIKSKLRTEGRKLIPRFYREYKGASDWWHSVRVDGKDYDLNFLTHDPDGTGEFPAKLRNAVKVVAYKDGIDGKFIRLGYFNGRYKMGNRMYKDRRAIEENPAMSSHQSSMEKYFSTLRYPKTDPAYPYYTKYGWLFEHFLSKQLIPDLIESGDIETAKDFKTGLTILTKGRERDNIKKAVYFINYLDNRFIPDLVDSGKLATASDFKLLSRIIKHRVLNNRYSSVVPNPAPNGNDQMARELLLFTENDEILLNRRYPQFVLNLERKIKRGVYDREKAVKLFMYLADEASKRYSKQFGDSKTHAADVPTRMLLAKMLRDRFENERQTESGDLEEPMGIIRGKRVLRKNPARRKLWKLGENGGYIRAIVNEAGNVVQITNSDYSDKPIKDGAYGAIFRWPLDKFNLEMHLTNFTTSYYASKIIEWVESVTK